VVARTAMIMGRTVETSETDSSGMKQLQRSNRNK